jgi:hypothetical protein
VVLKHPVLYRQGRDNLDMNMSQLSLWLCYAVVHSLLVFWLPYASFAAQDTVWDAAGKGLTDGFDVRGFAVFCTMTWAMQLSVSLNTLHWTRWNYGLIIFSQTVFYLFCITLSSSATFSWEFVGVTLQTLARPAFYLNIALSCAALTLLDLGVKATRLAVAPQACETARVWESLKKPWPEEAGSSSIVSSSAPSSSSSSNSSAKNLTAPRR